MATWKVNVEPETGQIISVEPPEPLKVDLLRGESARTEFSIEYVEVKLFNPPRVHIDSRHVGNNYRVETDARQISYFTIDLVGYRGTKVLEVTQLAQPPLMPQPLELKLTIGELSEPYTPAARVMTDLHPIEHVPPHQPGLVDVIIENIYYGDDKAKISFGEMRAKGNDPEVPETSHRIIAGGTVARVKYAALSEEKNYQLSVMRNNVAVWFTISTKADPKRTG